MSAVNVDADQLCAEVAAALGRPQDPTVAGWGVEDEMQFLMIRMDRDCSDNGLRVLAGLQARLLLTEEQAQTQHNALSAASLVLAAVADGRQPDPRDLALVRTLVEQAGSDLSTLLAQQARGAGQG